MINLESNLRTVYFYIEDNVVFNISSSDNGDICAKKGVSGTPQSNEAKVPYITVTNTETEAVTNYFLTNLISDGDKYTSNKFKKHSHDGTEKTIPQYYEQLCEEQLMLDIINNPQKEFDYWKEHKLSLGIPIWMLSGEGYNVTTVTQITFDETYFNSLKNRVVQQQAYNAAQNRTNDFNYKVTSTKDNLTVAKND